MAEVPPWGSNQPTLHWFGLTSGWYWVESPAGQLLSYSDEAVRHWELARPHPDYYLARFWEDLLVLRWVLQD